MPSARVPGPPSSCEVWQNVCHLCGACNAAPAGKAHIPPSCIGCGTSPVPLLRPDYTMGDWHHNPDSVEESRRKDAEARERRRANRDERRARLARAVLALRRAGE